MDCSATLMVFYYHIKLKLHIILEIKSVESLGLCIIIYIPSHYQFELKMAHNHHKTIEASRNKVINRSITFRKNQLQQ